MKNQFHESLLDKTKILVEDFYTYLSEVISHFEGRNYRYYVMDLKEEDSSNRKVRYHFLASIHLHGLEKPLENIQELNQLQSYAPKGSLIFLANTNKAKTSVIYDDLQVNLNKAVLQQYPYLEEVCLDLANLLIQNFGSISYRKLSQDIPKTYEKQIIERKYFLGEEQKRILEEMRRTDVEIQKIIDFVDTVNLSDKDKKIIQYNLEKILKMRRNERC